MWIIPSKHPLYSVYAQECVDSKEELSELSGQLEQSLMWRSRVLSLKIWSGKWSKVYWLPHLFGRTLKPSRSKDFTERYTASLEDIRVNHSVKQENKEVLETQGTYGHTSKPGLQQLALFGASSKTSVTTSISDTSKSEQTYKDLVTQCNKEFFQRTKLALHTYAKDSSSLPWPTPISSMGGSNNNSHLHGTNLVGAVKTWTTPVASDLSFRNTKYKQGGNPLSYQVKEWTTPSARDWKDSPGMIAQRKDGKSRMDQLPRQVFHWDKVNSNGSGKPLGLNPAWVLQLMGTTIEKTFFAWREMELLSKRQSSHG